MEPVLQNLIFISFRQYTFNSITGAFQVPVPKGPTGSGVAIWVAIDDSTLCDGMFLSGVNLAVGDNNEPSYDGKESSPFTFMDHLIHVLTCSLVDVVSGQFSVVLQLPGLCWRCHSRHPQCDIKYERTRLDGERHQEPHRGPGSRLRPRALRDKRRVDRRPHWSWSWQDPSLGRLRDGEVYGRCGLWRKRCKLRTRRRHYMENQASWQSLDLCQDCGVFCHCPLCVELPQQ